MKHHTNDYFDFSWDFTNGCSHNCQFCKLPEFFGEFRSYDINENVRFIPDVFCKPFPIQANFIHCSLHSEPSDWDNFTWMIFLDRISKNSNKKFLITTRFPRKLIGRTYPNNLWIGIACENQVSYELRAEALNHIDVKRKFIIFEPLKEEIYLCSDFKKLDWCVIGVDRRKIKLPMDIILSLIHI